MSANNSKKFITWSPDQPSGLNWVVFQPDDTTEGLPPNEGIAPSGQLLGEYATYVEARNAHPDARITTSAAEAIKYGNI